jgi:riboflavin synthase
MFTGLVERTGRVISLSKTHGDMLTLVIDPGKDFSRDHGDSIAVNGVCLSEVGDVSATNLSFHVSPETLARTSLSALTPGHLVNLERSLRPNDRLGGHFVLGHVDDRGVITGIKSENGFHILDIKISKDFAKYVVKKGSIAIDGVSLTINQVEDGHDDCLLTFTIVPVTWQTTRLSQCQVNDIVNIEVDMIAKHLERLTEAWNTKR